MNRRGVMLIDLLVAMAIIGVVLLGVLPMMRSEGPLQLVAGSSMVAADVELAQSRTLANPADPTVFVLNDDGSGYWLALLSDPLVPIVGPNGDAWDRTFGAGELADLEGCALVAEGATRLPDEGPMVVIFDGFGRLETEDDIVITLSNYAGQQVVHVRAATGTVSILAEAPAKEPEGVIEKGTLGSGSGLSLPSR